jgi:hypothetical protein
VNKYLYNKYLTQELYSPIKELPPIPSFSIGNPYDVEGEYRKAQLHLHTGYSYDVLSKAPISKTIEKYKKTNYSFIVITDHDVVTNIESFNDSQFLVIPGIEKTIPIPFILLYGKHLIKINGKNGILMPAHPNWAGNMGSGYWRINDLIKLKDLFLIEIYNHHSDPKFDVQLWHKILEKRNHKNPLWGVAVDDSNNAEVIDRGWIMIKTNAINIESFLNALKKGSFYATTGPEADFNIEDNILTVTTYAENKVLFINNKNHTLSSQYGIGRYGFTGNEGFVRVEVHSPNGKIAWSQPFFIKPK